MKVLALFTLLVVVSATTPSNPADNVDSFLRCLPNHIHHSVPIQDVVFTPKNSSFQEVLEEYLKNLRFLSPNTKKPEAIITPLVESHIQATINCAKDSSLQIRIRSGGHDWEGLSYRSNTSFVILDMFNLRSIDINIASETAWVQSGAILGELYYEISKKSKVYAFPAGVCPTVGIGGHFSGGGYGNLMRKYGLSVDNVIDALFVDYNGNIYDRVSMGEDLFWAIRGGGGASFGVILSWKVKLVRVPPIVTVFDVPRTLEQGATNVFYRWQQISTTIDKNLYIRAQPEIQNPSNETEKKTVQVRFIGHFLGQKSKLLSLIKTKFSELGLKPEDCHEMSWVESTMFWDNGAIGTPIEGIVKRTGLANVLFKSKSDYVKDIIPKNDLKKIWKMFMETEGMIMQWNPYGGRMGEIGDTETPFPHRKGYLFKIQYLVITLAKDGARTHDRGISLQKKMYDRMASYVSKNPRECYLNYRDLDIGSNPSNETNFQEALVYGLKYFKNNFVRLTKVKKSIDPFNFFKNEQSIPPI